MRLFVKDKNFYKKTAAIAIPVSLQSLISIGVNMTDNIMVGSLGETALSELPWLNQFTGIFHIGCMGHINGSKWF